MSDSTTTATVPTLSTFVRDHLAEWLDGLGHSVGCYSADGFPCLTVETWDGATWDDVAVTSDGRTMSMVDGWQEVRLRGFQWVAEPTDTRRVHGPIAMAPCTRCALPIPRAPWMPTKDAIHPCCLAAEAIARGTFGTDRRV